MAKQKISDLPKDEQEKLTAQMKEFKIRGIYTGFTVEKALELIEKEKAKVNDINDYTDIKISAQNKEADEKNKDNCTDNQVAIKNVLNQPKIVKTYICHICRSKVISGKCTGCGFVLKV